MIAALIIITYIIGFGYSQVTCNGPANNLTWFIVWVISPILMIGFGLASIGIKLFRWTDKTINQSE